MMNYDVGPYILNNAPLPAGDEMSAVAMILLMLWLALLVSLAVIEPGGARRPD